VGQILLEIKAFTYLNKMPHKSGLVKICPQKLKAYHNALAENFKCIWRAHYQAELFLCKGQGILKSGMITT
jgi:hypothetical protein